MCGLIGGFYLLRFINPAIVTPQAFMLVENTLSANTRRNLTLVLPSPLALSLKASLAHPLLLVSLRRTKHSSPRFCKTSPTTSSLAV